MKDKQQEDRQAQNVVASIRQRLLNYARAHGEDYQYVLTRYGLERLLYRISRSAHAESFVLKGATLFHLWSDQPHRPTRDLDLLGYGEPSIERYRQLFHDICSAAFEADGLTVLTDTMRIDQMKDDDEYQGLRLRIDGRLGNAVIPLQIDIGFGDAITPGTEEILFPTLLDQPAPSLRAYPRETVVAEKFQAMVTLGIANSRMKDFYDLWVLANGFSFDGKTLSRAIEATFHRRQTALPTVVPLALTSEFTTDANKAKQWSAFITKGKLIERSVSLPEITDRLLPFLMEPTRAIVSRKPFTPNWPPSGPWT